MKGKTGIVRNYSQKKDGMRQKSDELCVRRPHVAVTVGQFLISPFGV